MFRIYYVSIGFEFGTYFVIKSFITDRILKAEMNATIHQNKKLHKHHRNPLWISII